MYGLLGIRPIKQELDIRKLILLGCILVHRDTLEYEIAHRQLLVKSIDSRSWFLECNRLLNKYSLPNVYALEKEITSLKRWKGQLKLAQSQRTSDSKKSLKYINLASLRVGEVH